MIDKVKHYVLGFLGLLTLVLMITTGFLADFGKGNIIAWNIGLVTSILIALIAISYLLIAKSSGDVQSMQKLLVVLTFSVLMFIFTIFDIVGVGHLHGYTAVMYYTLPILSLVIFAGQ